MHWGDSNFKLSDWSLTSTLHQHKVLQFTIYTFQFWAIRELETITQPSPFFRCSHISLVNSHRPNGQNDSENVPAYILTNIIGNYDIIVLCETVLFFKIFSFGEYFCISKCLGSAVAKFVLMINTHMVNRVKGTLARTKK